MATINYIRGFVRFLMLRLPFVHIAKSRWRSLRFMRHHLCYRYGAMFLLGELGSPLLARPLTRELRNFLGGSEGKDGKKSSR